MNFLFPQHQGISEVPSACFYGGGLKALTKPQLGPSELDVWPGTRAKPFVFCHVVGQEQVVTVATADQGVVQSIANATEAEAVVSHLLILYGRVQWNRCNTNTDKPYYF